jgi:hypothetical protein
MAGLGWQVLQRDLDFNAGGAGLRFIHGIDLVIHEAGHTFGLILPRFFSILGGSAFQVLLPAVCALIFLHQRQLASFAVALFWTGESVTDVAIYMADAKQPALPLLGGHGTVHDWNYLLGQLHLLGWAGSIARLTLGVGILLITVALAIVANETHRAWQRACSIVSRAKAHTATTATCWAASQPETLAQACGSRRCQARTAAAGTTT